MVTTVLLADDHKIMRDGLRALLEQTPGVEVVGEAEDGEAAVELARELKPSIVIMDIAMPKLGGVKATQQIVSENPETSVIALSMHREKQFVQGMLKAGARGYLLKESAFEELTLALQTVASGNIHISPSVAGVLVEDFVTRGRQTGSASPQLSKRQREVLQLIADGQSTKKAAEILNVSAKTIESHRKHIMDKLDLHNVADLTKYAVRHGISSLNP